MILSAPGLAGPRRCLVLSANGAACPTGSSSGNWQAT